MPDPTPLVSDGLGAGIIAAITATGAGFVTFLKWAVNQWLADRKEDRSERSEDRRVQVELQLSVAALVERDRIREERRRRESGQVSVPRREFDREEITDVTVIKDRLREAAVSSRKTPPKGVRNTPNEDR